jgi:NADH:ubiquinone oxidoreductase subunit 4 (subunit M)
LIALLSKRTEDTIEAKEAPLLMVGVGMVMAVLIIVLGFYPGPIVGFASEASKSLIEGLGNYIGAVL